jgi:SAM-dependent methyltransferase
MSPPNRDDAVIRDFGFEWSTYEMGATHSELRAQFESTFAIFPWSSLPQNAQGFDLGCGSGRWDLFLAPRVGHLHCIEPSAAIDVARKQLSHLPNVSFHQAAVDAIPLPENSMDFGVSIGVLHYIPDTRAGIRACASRLKPGAPLLLYLFYDFENRPLWFRTVWKASDVVRRIVSRLPSRPKYHVTAMIALLAYLPLARFAALVEYLGAPSGYVDRVPLAQYRKKSFYMMRTDALNRLGSRIEKRFSRAEITRMMEDAGLTDIEFKDGRPYWIALGWKSPGDDRSSEGGSAQA